MSSIPFSDLNAQFRAYEEEIRTAVDSVMTSSRFIGGPEVSSLEEELADFTGARHAISCGSGTDALMIAFLALGMGPGDEVVTTPFTFFATAGAAAVLGIKPVFVDIDPATLQISPEKISSAVTKATKAIIPVGLYGTPADMDEINSVASEYGVPVIEDSAQSLGAPYRDRVSGALGHIGCTSFYPAKPLGAYGEGGALFTDDDDLAKVLRMTMNQGQDCTYSHSCLGFNGRLDAMQAAILRVKLRHLPEELATRNRIAARYAAGLEGSAAETTVVPEDRGSSWAQYTVRVSERESFREALQERGVPTAVHYPVPLYRQPVFKHLDSDPANFPVAEDAARRVVSLPMSPFLKEKDQDRVIQAVTEVLGGGR